MDAEAVDCLLHPKVSVMHIRFAWNLDGHRSVRERPEGVSRFVYTGVECDMVGLIA